MPPPPEPLAPRFPDDWPRLGMGLAPLGDIFRSHTEEEAQDAMRAAWEAGVRYYDTAPWYGHGLSEHRLGTFLRSVPRAEAVVSTKVGRLYRPARRGEAAGLAWAGGFNMAMRWDYSAAGVEEAALQSRLRMGQSSLDLLLVHDLDREHHGEGYEARLKEFEGGLARLWRMKAEGEIAAVGMGINALAEFAELAPWVEVDVFLVAMPYTLLDQASLGGPMAACLRRGIKVIIGAPFASGLLADPSNPRLLYNYRPVPAEVRARALAIAAVCGAHGVPLMAAALQFVLRHPAVVAVIPGAETPAHARLNAENARRPIPEALWDELKARGLIDPESP